MKKSLFVFLCCLAFLAFETKGTALPPPQTWCVSNAAELQTALNTASSNGLDNVIMVVQGTYKGNFTYNSSSGLSITLQGGYTAGCVSQVFSPAKTVLDGNHSGVVLSLIDNNGGSFSVEEFTIRNGNNITGNGGGGVYAQSSSISAAGGNITLSGNTFIGNTSAENGGGVYAYSYSGSGTGGTIVVFGNTFTGNYAYYAGGGVYADSYSNSGAGGPITFQWNTFTGNTAGGGGGGVSASSEGETGSGEIYFYENTIKGNYAYYAGGGVDAYSSSDSGTGGPIVLFGNTITGNYAYEQAGGVYADSYSNSGTSGAISLMENTITGNYAYVAGGGVYAYSYSGSGTGGITLTENTITGNYGYEGAGGVWAWSYSGSGTGGAVTMSQNTISGNTAYGQSLGGAGVYITSNTNSATGGAVTFTENTVMNNHMYGDGGGVYCTLSTQTGTTGAVSFEANTITGNTALYSFGAVYAYADSYSSGTTGAITFTNNIIAANTASNTGGVYAESYSSSGTTGPITFTNNTITKNSRLYGAGGVEVGMSNNTFNFYNNISWGNTGSDIFLSGTGTAYGYNNDYNVISGSWTGESGNINANPLFDAYGYYHLTPTSPCINAGDNSAPSLPTTDIDGNNRVIGPAVDIGAVEYNGPLIAKGPANESSFGDWTFTNKYQPTFQWIAVEPFKSFEIVFATTPDFSSGIITTASVSGTTSSWTPPIPTWEKIMSESYNGGGSTLPIYWEVVGTEANNSKTETPVRQVSVSSASLPTILSPANGAVLPAAQYPTFIFLMNYNIYFQLEISTSSSFTVPIIAYKYTVTNPITTPILEETLSSSQWAAVKKLIGTSTGYFRIRGWDGINRESDSAPQSFTIQ